MIHIPTTSSVADPKGAPGAGNPYFFTINTFEWGQMDGDPFLSWVRTTTLPFFK